MTKLAKIIPEWVTLLNKSLNYDKTETYRTLRHIFRSLWVYFGIINENFKPRIKKKNINSLKRNLEKIFRFNQDFFPLLLLYHDIGRPLNREWHNFESAKIIKQNKSFRNYSLSYIQNLILYGVIKHHLLLGTIFTGESSYYGAVSLFNDENLFDIWSSSENIDVFFRVLMAFTIVDIWGYDYSKIYDHYFLYYDQIRENLTRVFIKIKSLDIQERPISLCREFAGIDKNFLKWRIACALRIFQFVNTRPYLTREFYFTKIDKSLNSMGQNWKLFVDSLGANHSATQFKYSLPIMMVLASGAFKRKPLDFKERIQPEIFKFWQITTHIKCSFNKKFQSLYKNFSPLKNIVFKLPYRWFLKPNYLKLVLSDSFFKILKQSSPKFVPKIGSYQINVNLVI
ncbi:MAG: hypothetical protein ACFFAN_18435 [Promethearchaeota archaeon]